MSLVKGMRKGGTHKSQFSVFTVAYFLTFIQFLYRTIYHAGFIFEKCPVKILDVTIISSIPGYPELVEEFDFDSYWSSVVSHFTESSK
jgi:hypothetical protein